MILLNLPAVLALNPTKSHRKETEPTGRWAPTEIVLGGVGSFPTYLPKLRKERRDVGRTDEV